MDVSELSQVVIEKYSGVARDAPPTEYSRSVAASFGYSEEQLSSIPDSANMGLSCGNPTAVANLRIGEVVVDLGSGGGLDVFLAAQKIGDGGMAIGLDFSEDMIILARRNAEKRGRMSNVRFEKAAITKLPLGNNFVDCVISNCVINLVPDSEKQIVLSEVFRVLKPGGRMSISDIVAHQPLPPAVKHDIASYVGCVSGALELELYKKMLISAGFPDAVFVDTKKDLNVYKTAAPPTSTGCCKQSIIGGLSSDLNYNVNDYVGSFQIYAVKPQ